MADGEKRTDFDTFIFVDHSALPLTPSGIRLCCHPQLRKRMWFLNRLLRLQPSFKKDFRQPGKTSPQPGKPLSPLRR